MKHPLKGRARAARRAKCRHWLINTDSKTCVPGSWTDKSNHFVVFAPSPEEALRKAGLVK